MMTLRAPLAFPLLCVAALALLSFIPAAHAQADEAQWLPWDPAPDDFRESPMDLRWLNEAYAGEHGYIQPQGEHFIHAANGQQVRFWAVNGPPDKLSDEELARCARMLAKRGVNLVRIHRSVFDEKTGELKPGAAQRIQREVRTMKAEGIYTHLSIYFPLWFKPAADLPWLEGYDGKQHPFAAIYFNPGFQEKYRSWWAALLAPSAETSGVSLLEEPALMGVELVNEDSYFFWTFKPENLPAPQLELVERQFGQWLAERHGSLEAAFTAWGTPLPRDDAAAGRAAIRTLWDIFTHKTQRDQETAAFLLDSQTRFYAETIQYLRGLGLKSMIHASNWTTANNAILGPLEKASCFPGDFMDRHGYFGTQREGLHDNWSIRDGHTFVHQSALRFEEGGPGAPAKFTTPVVDPMYNGRPSMISETTFERPNRYRTEAPLYYAAYGALQGTDAVVHFALDGAGWQVKPRFFMQPWTLMSPTQMGQFPAAALIYRRGLLQAGALVRQRHLSMDDALSLKGSPLSPEANLDALRAADVDVDAVAPEVLEAQRIDPLTFFVGRTNLHISNGALKPINDVDLSKFIDRKAHTVTSSTGELKLDYWTGRLQLNAPSAQGAVGNLAAGGTLELANLTITSSLDLGCIVAVALDDQPLETSRSILLQVLTEEKPTGFETTPAGGNRDDDVLRIESIGNDPWLYRASQGTVRFKRAADAPPLKVQPLDLNGYPDGAPLDAASTKDEITLRPGTVYYHLSGE